MIVTWAGRTYEIGGAPAADAEAIWQLLLEENGQQMTQEWFDGLSPDGQAWLRDAVRLYVERGTEA